MRMEAYCGSYGLLPSVGFQPKQRGFSLTELLLVAGLIAFSSIAVPSFSHFLDQSRVEAAILNLRTALAMARTEAITRDEYIVLCRSDGDLQRCAGTSAKKRLDWSHGWLMYLDKNKDKAFDQADGDLILRVFPPLARKLVLKWNRGDYIAYQGSGRLSSLNGTFCIGTDTGVVSFNRELKIPYTGRVRITEDECTYSLLEDG